MSLEVVKTTRITQRDNLRLQILNLNFSDIVREALDKKFEGLFIEDLDRKEKELKDELEKVRILRETFNPLPKNEMEENFLRETKSILEKEPKYIKGRISSYSYQFNKPILSESEFKALLEKY